MSNGKLMIIHVIVALIQKISLYKMSYFPEPYICRKNKIKVKLDLTNYERKCDLKSATSVDISELAKKVDLGS